MLNKEQQEIYLKIRTHLGELHKKWQEDPNEDGHCKSNEGYVGILFRGRNWFECENNKDKYIQSPLEVDVVEVYSYLFGPSRLHSFDSLEEAWEEVKKWEY